MTTTRGGHGRSRRWLAVSSLGGAFLVHACVSVADAGRAGPLASAIFDADGKAATLRLDVGAPAAIGSCGEQGADCWTVGSVVTLAATVSVAGHDVACSKRCRLPVGQVLTLLDTQRYAWTPALAAFCPRGGGFVPADAGTVSPGPRRKLLLTPDTQPDLESCVGNGAKFTSAVRPSRDGAKLSGTTLIRGRVTQPTNVGPARIGFSVRFDHFGIPVGSGDPSLPNAKDCGTTIILRCAS